MPASEHQIDWVSVYAGGDHAASFKAFHDANPWVLRRLISMALRLKCRGHQRVGIAMLFETLRYERMTTVSAEPFKLNNTYRAYYVRLIEQTEPQLKGLFQKRRSAADKADPGAPIGAE